VASSSESNLADVAILTRAVENVFRKLIRMLVGKISLKKLQEMVQVIFVEEAEAKLQKERPGKNVPLSTLAVVSGFDTRTLTRIKGTDNYLRPFHQAQRFLSEITPECSVLDVWESSPKYRDEETGNHVIRMAKYSRVIAEQMGLSKDECDAIELAAPMHDIGKIGIPDEILRKPARLTHCEFEIMKTHTQIGYEILKDSPSKYLQMGAIIALSHHERFNGAGYPNKLGGQEIPLAARIVSVADAYDALTSERPYKPRWEMQKALDYINEQRGRFFDPACLDAFMAQLDRISKIQYTLGDQEERLTASR